MSPRADASTTQASVIPTVLPLDEREFVNFSGSSVSRDVGQSSTPRFDARPLEPQSEVAISGIGMYWDQINDLEKGVLKLRLTSYDKSMNNINHFVALNQTEVGILEKLYT